MSDSKSNANVRYAIYHGIPVIIIILGIISQFRNLDNSNYMYTSTEVPKQLAAFCLHRDVTTGIYVTFIVLSFVTYIALGLSYIQKWTDKDKYRVYSTATSMQDATVAFYGVYFLGVKDMSVLLLCSLFFLVHKLDLHSRLRSGSSPNSWSIGGILMSLLFSYILIGWVSYPSTVYILPVVGSLCIMTAIDSVYPSQDKTSYMRAFTVVGTQILILFSAIATMAHSKYSPEAVFSSVECG